MTSLGIKFELQIGQPSQHRVNLSRQRLAMASSQAAFFAYLVAVQAGFAEGWGQFMLMDQNLKTPNFVWKQQTLGYGKACGELWHVDFRTVYKGANNRVFKRFGLMLIWYRP